MITIPNWMFLSSYSSLRSLIVENFYIDSFCHNGRGVWGSDFGSCAFVFRKSNIPKFIGKYKRLFKIQGSVSSNDELERRFFEYDDFYASSDDFKVIPGNPVSYWITKGIRGAFESRRTLKEIGDTRQGMATSDNNRFLRFWSEVSFDKSFFSAKNHREAQQAGRKWFPYNKGGDFRKWYGNSEYLISWENDGEELLNYAKSLYGSPTRTIKSISEYFKPCISWSKVSSGNLAMRFYPEGYLFDVAGCCIFSQDKNELMFLIGYANTPMVRSFLQTISPTLNFEAGQIASLPIPSGEIAGFVTMPADLINIAKHDWDSYETSWDFIRIPLLHPHCKQVTVRGSYLQLLDSWNERIHETGRLESENNRLFMETFGLQGELSSTVPLEEITLSCNPHYRYGGNRSKEELDALLQCDTLRELVSYAIGCMMGRYSLDTPGLILASQGETLQDYLNQIPEPRFVPDDDAILPLTDQEWFADDATNRLREFIRVVWGDEHLQENLDFVAESLCLHAIKPKRGESALDTIRRYLSSQFFKDHLRTYKKRPIYWLFSSGKQKAFECLVYLHRYNEGTLARMRTEYVIPLSAKLNAYAEKLEQDKEASTSAVETKHLEREITTLHKQQTELAEFDEKLRHYADQRISLDLDDGVKVNYGKFGDLLAEVKAVTGEKAT
jgi:type II restriction/modification system DNA methylase subunit YeeA